MPNRILRDWTDSEKVNALTVNAERFFTRLIMKVDDYGRFPAHPRLLKSNLFPFSDDIRDADITRWMAECQKTGLILVYDVNQKPYLQIENFKQRLDKSREKYPSPEKSKKNDFPETVTDFPAETKRNETESETEKKPKARAREGDLVFKSDSLSDQWLRWEKYQKDQFRFSYKSDDSRNMAKNKLWKMAEENPAVAIAIIEQSIEKGWKGLFELKVAAAKNTQDDKVYKRPKRDEMPQDIVVDRDCATKHIGEALQKMGYKPSES